MPPLAVKSAERVRNRPSAAPGPWLWGWILVLGGCAPGQNPRVGPPAYESPSQRTNDSAPLSQNHKQDGTESTDADTPDSLGAGLGSEVQSSVTQVSLFPPEINVGSALVTLSTQVVRIPLSVRVRDPKALSAGVTLTQSADFREMGSLTDASVSPKPGLGPVYQAETYIPLPQKLTSGTYMGTITATDGAGNRSQKSFQIVVNRSY